MMPGVQPAEQRRADPANVQVTGGARGKTGLDGHQGIFNMGDSKRRAILAKAQQCVWPIRSGKLTAGSDAK